MTRRQPSTVHVSRDAGLRETRSRFLLAREQSAAHAVTAHYVRIREMDRWAALRAVH
jgi:hypothetical protein